MTRAMLALFSVLSISCGGGDDASQSTADTGTPSDTGVDAPARSPNSASIEVNVAPGEEKTVCIYVRMANPEPSYITKTVAELMPGSHHLIIYRASELEENLNPTRCAPFSGLLSGKEVMIGEAARPLAETKMPPNVGLKIDANQMLKLEAHYINTTKNPIMGRGKVTFDLTPIAKAPGMIEANGYFWGTTKLNIPPKTVWDTGVKFQAGLQGTKAFFMSTHQHRLGTKMTLWSSKSPMDTTSAPLVEETNWAEPAMFPVDPPIEFDGVSGISYKCEYNNTTDSMITFGESALQEMCFTFGWYYPSKIYDVCVDNVCLNRKAL
jgi:hypothetical protein